MYATGGGARAGAGDARGLRAREGVTGRCSSACWQLSLCDARGKQLSSERAVSTGMMSSSWAMGETHNRASSCSRACCVTARDGSRGGKPTCRATQTSV